MTKMLSASGALPPDPRYRLVLRTRHDASQPVTPSAAYASEAEPPLLHITTLTTDYTPIITAFEIYSPARQTHIT